MEISSKMIGAIIFDFNGVIIDDEPIHARLLTEIAAREGLTIPGGDPLEAFLGIRDEVCFERMLHDKGDSFDRVEIDRLTKLKDELYIAELTEKGIPLFSGITEFIEQAADRWPLAIASGALTEEICFVLQENNLDRFFKGIAGGDLAVEGKPAPDIYLAALDKLNAELDRPIGVGECLAIEDSPAGIASAHAAGMKVLALATSLDRQKLTAADAILERLDGVTVEDLEKMFEDGFETSVKLGVK